MSEVIAVVFGFVINRVCISSGVRFIITDDVYRSDLKICKERTAFRDVGLVSVVNVGLFLQHNLNIVYSAINIVVDILLVRYLACCVDTCVKDIVGLYVR